MDSLLTTASSDRNIQQGMWKSFYIEPNILMPRTRLFVRWLRFGIRFLLYGDLELATKAATTEFQLMKLTLSDLANGSKNKECNLCGWKGRSFYPNVGPGYYESETICPRCLCQDRHRSMAAVLHANTSCFGPDTKVVEVAPMRSFQQYCLHVKGNKNYVSFDIERFAMEKGDITKMRFADSSIDYFLCFHVLEHIKEEGKALNEINRILRPGGYAILQVPIDWQADKTIEYPAPNVREANHVRQYGKDFSAIVAAHKFDVMSISVSDCLLPSQIEHYGLSSEPIFIAKKQ